MNFKTDGPMISDGILALRPAAFLSTSLGFSLTIIRSIQTYRWGYRQGMLLRRHSAQTGRSPKINGREPSSITRGRHRKMNWHSPTGRFAPGGSASAVESGTLMAGSN
jgi:hypothetical protein